MKTKKHYIAFLDILGFKELIENNSLEYVITLYEQFEPSLLFTMAFTNMDWRMYNQNEDELPGIDKTPLNSLTISDSIIIWSDDATGNSFIQLLQTVRHHLALAMLFGIPLRGAITFGEIAIKSGKHEKSNKQNGFNTILGRPLTKAYLLENQAEWSGCIVDDECIEYYNNLIKEAENPPDSEFLEKLNFLKRYNVPSKNGLIKEFYTVNWTHSAPTRIDRNIIRESFGKHNKLVDNWNVETKIRNTLDFYDATERDYKDYLDFTKESRIKVTPPL